MPKRQTELVLSASAISAFLSCPKRYAYRYVERLEPIERAAPLTRGTAIHNAIQSWWRGESTIPAFEEWYSESKRRMTDGEFEQFESDYAHCVALIGRYVDYWKQPPQGAVIIGQEYELSVKVRKGLRMVGYMDELVTFGGMVTGVEHKTSSRLEQRMSYLNVDPQVTTYIAGLRKNRVPIANVLWDGINTYPYRKLDEVPGHKLFKRATLMRTDAEIAQFWADTENTAEDIERSHARDFFVRNVGPGCNRCDFQDVCFAEIEQDFVRAEAFKRTHFKLREDNREKQ